MVIFKNYKCPNGNPPELCRHAPQLINNLASYLSSKKQDKQAEIKAKAVSANGAPLRQRVKSR